MLESLHIHVEMGTLIAISLVYLIGSLIISISIHDVWSNKIPRIFRILLSFLSGIIWPAIIVLTTLYLIIVFYVKAK